MFENKKYPQKRMRKKENIVREKFNDELKYEFSTEKIPEYFEEFVKFHLTKWSTFKSPQTKNFYRDLYLNNDFTILSRLYLEKSGRSVGYDLKYLGSDKILYGCMSGFDPEFYDVSPGTYLTYQDLLKPELFTTIKHYDLGRGSYEYKYFFTNTEQIVLSLKADLCPVPNKYYPAPIRTFRKILSNMF